MKKNIGITLFLFFLCMVVFFEACTSLDNDSKININDSTELKLNKDVVDLQEFYNVSTVTQEEYSRMSSQLKTEFYNDYLSMLRGNGCTCSSGGNSCSIECPEGTKPKCQCDKSGADCGCEPFGNGGIQMVYRIITNSDENTVTLIKKPSNKSLKSFKTSGLPNANKIVDLFFSESEFQNINKEEIILSNKSFIKLQSKFQQLMESYTPEQYFRVEYEF